MRIDLLIASLIIMILGFVIGGLFGSILLGVGILLLIYVIFTRSPESKARYVEPEHPQKSKKTYQRNTREPREKKSTARYVEEPKPRYKNVNRAENELKAWGPGSSGKKCSSCGSTSNPSNAKFCADCGKKL